MAIAVATTRQTLSNAYAAIGGYVGISTADPGITPTPANEATGGTPAYARKLATWTPATGGVNNGSPVTIDLAAGTYTYGFMASAATGNVMFDKAAIASVTYSVQGQLVVTPVFTIT
jgi:hypothetical protein